MRTSTTVSSSVAAAVNGILKEDQYTLGSLLSFGQALTGKDWSEMAIPGDIAGRLMVAALSGASDPAQNCDNIAVESFHTENGKATETVETSPPDAEEFAASAELNPPTPASKRNGRSSVISKEERSLLKEHGLPTPNLAKARELLPKRTLSTTLNEVMNQIDPKGKLREKILTEVSERTSIGQVYARAIAEPYIEDEKYDSILKRVPRVAAEQLAKLTEPEAAAVAS